MIDYKRFKYQNLDRTFDVIKYLCSDKSSNALIDFWHYPRLSIFPDLKTTLFLHQKDGTYPGVWFGAHNSLAKMYMDYPIVFPDRGEMPEIPLVLWDGGLPLQYSCRKAIGDIYPVCMHVLSTQTILYAEMNARDAMKLMLDFEGLDLSKPYFSAFKQLYEMKYDVEFVAVRRRGKHIDEVYEYARIPANYMNRKKGILDIHKELIGTGWQPLILEVVDPSSRYKPNIVFWYVQELDGSDPRPEFHTISNNIIQSDKEILKTNDLINYKIDTSWIEGWLKSDIEE